MNAPQLKEAKKTNKIPHYAVLGHQIWMQQLDSSHRDFAAISILPTTTIDKQTATELLKTMPVTLVASNKHIKKSRSETRKHSSFKDKGQSNIFIQDQVTTRVAGFSSMCWKRLIIHNNCNIEMTITCDELFLVTEFKGRVMHIKPATSVRGRRATQS